MTWKKFTIYIHPDKIAIHFPMLPRYSDESGGRFFGMLRDSGFEPMRKTHLIWEKERSEFWVKECYRLAEKFSKYSVEIIEYKTQAQSHASNNLIEKIKKLLALSTSPNENEAAVAAQKANELLAAHNLSMADLGDNAADVEVEELVLEEMGKKIPWKSYLVNALAKANYCKSFLNQTRDGVQRVLVGKPVNILACQQMYDYLVQTVNRLCDEQTAGTSRAYKNSFRLGCAERLSYRIIETFEQQQDQGIAATSDAEGMSAIVLNSLFERREKENNYYLNRHHPNLETVRSRSSCSSSSGYNAGSQAGNSVSLNKQVGGQRRLGGAK